MVAILGTVFLVLLLLVGLGWYLSYLAGRLDALHHRVETSRASLDAQLARRAEAALHLARSVAGDPGDHLRAAAGQALASAGDEPEAHPRALDEPVDEAAQNALTRALDAAFPAGGPGQPWSSTLEVRTPVAELLAAGERVRLARRFHNDAVSHAQRMRRKRLVVVFRLAGHAAVPRMVELDDSLPAGLDDDPLA